MWPFNSPLQRGPGGALAHRGSYTPTAPMGGGAPVAPQGGMFNAWPTMLGGPQAAPALPAPQPAPGIGGLGAALGNTMKGGMAANAFGMFGSPQGGDDVKEQIRQQFLKAGRPDPFAPPATFGPGGSSFAPQAGAAPTFGPGGPAAPGAIPDMTNAQYPQPFTIGPDGVPMPTRRPNFGGVPLPQARPEGMAGASPTDYYNGPGSMSFGAGQGPSGNNYGNQGILSRLLAGA